MRNKILSIGFAFVAMFAFTAANAQELTIDKEVHDYGTIDQGANGECVFVVTNTGTAPLIISNCKGSCGCTVPTWPREPIAPGADGVVKVQFDSKNKGKVGGGLQSKRVTITANTDPVNTYLTIKGKVDKKEEAAPATNPS